MFTAAFYFSSVQANGQLDQILANMQKAAKNVTTIKSGISQVKKFSIGGRESYQGQMIFKHVGQSDKLRINYNNGNQISVDAKEAVLYQPPINQAIIISRGKLASENEELAFFSTPYKLTAPEIKARYDIAHVGTEDNTAVLELKPKGKSTVKRMKWWVDQSIWLPSKIETVDQTGDTTIFTLSGMQLNAKINEGDFKIKLPSGTNIIRK